MQVRERSSKISVILIGTLLTACATQRSSEVAPVEVPTSWISPTASNGANVGSDWWRDFGDQRLDQMVRRVLESNTDLLAAAERLRKADLEARSISTNMTPDISLGASVDWSTDPDKVHGVLREGGRVTSTLSYDLDVGGRRAAERDLANGNVKETESDVDWTRLRIVRESLLKYWKLGVLGERLTFAGERLALAKRIQGIVQARYKTGYASKIDLAEAQQKVLAEGIAIGRLKGEVLQNRNALAILLGGPPETTFSMPGDLFFRPLRPVAAGIPADVIHRRADVRAAEWRLRQTLANIDIARARLYPSLTITSSLGTSSVSLERFLSNPIANLGLAVALPFLQWNSTQLRIKVSQAEFDAAAHAFRKTVYVALREVEDNLAESGKLEQEESQLQEQLETARRAAHLAEVRFIAGETAIQPWLQSQQSLTDAREAVTQNHLDCLTNRADLLVALGGGTQDTRGADL
ncbi:TolC family protein [Caballeronia sp. AZ1_KS37]|uniref:TolC family protein n=1 Tax=Caballeronia sp. AZ1_KS37 TaxID=2921756 RepID=UPI002027B278